MAVIPWQNAYLAGMRLSLISGSEKIFFKVQIISLKLVFLNILNKGGYDRSFWLCRNAKYYILLLLGQKQPQAIWKLVCPSLYGGVIEITQNIDKHLEEQREKFECFQTQKTTRNVLCSLWWFEKKMAPIGSQEMTLLGGTDLEKV